MRLTLDTLHLYCDAEGDCLHWALGVNNCGYPQARIDGKTVLVRRYIFSTLLGKQLRRQQPVVSRCGSKLCLSPSCIHASTHGAVIKRQYRQGLRSSYVPYASRLATVMRTGAAKLTPEQVAEIRAIDDSVTHTEVAARYKVSQKCVSDVRRGLTWRTTAPNSSVFNWMPA